MTSSPSGIQNQISKSSWRDRRAEARVLIDESNHRIKNHLQMIAALLGLQARAASADVRAALFDAQNRIFAIARLHEHLQAAGDSPSVELSAFIAGLCEDFRFVFGTSLRKVRFRIEAEEVELPSQRAAALGLVVNELVTNAVKHAYAVRGGEILIRLARAYPGWRLTVADDGPGVSVEADVQGQRAGLGLVRQLVRTLRGELSVDQTPRGVSISIWFA
jgi:two-component sensor histidine kinase